MTNIQVGNFELEDVSVSKEPTRIAMLLWGDMGTFKTTLTATARGNKLYLLFDDGGLDSVKGLPEKLAITHPDLNTALKNKIYKIDVSKHDKTNYIANFENDDPFKLAPLLADPALDIRTVVVDSLTPLGDDCLTYAIKYKGYKDASITNPGRQAYGARLTLLKQFVINMLKLTAKYNKDIIFISHAKDKNDDKGSTVAISLALGGNLANEVGIKIGETWYVSNDRTNGRQITLVPFRLYAPMKTRMFALGPNKPTSFKWNYDIDNPDINLELATIFDNWDKVGYQKMELPK